MIKATGYAAQQPKEALKPFEFERRDVGDNDVLIDIAYCGICHSDIHMARDEWGGDALFPMVPGHEIVGTVKQIGKNVSQFSVGDIVGVGCMVDSCRTCENCTEKLEQYCEKKVLTYASNNYNTNEITKGGYANNVVVDQDFVLRIPKGMDLAATAPLLCAGITTYSPLRHWQVGQGSKVGVVGLGGLGHMAVKIAKAMGAEVTVFTRTKTKIDAAKTLGADHVIITTDAKSLQSSIKQLDLIIDTVAAKHDIEPYISALKRDGTLVFVGIPDKTLDFPNMFNVVLFRRSMAGSLIGGITETQEMLDFCAEHNITADIELIDIKNVNTAYERVLKSDVKYRFVIDMATLPAAA